MYFTRVYNIEKSIVSEVVRNETVTCM